MRGISWQIFVLSCGILSVSTQSTEKSSFTAGGSDKLEGDHYAVLRSRFNQYFSSFPHSYQNFSGLNSVLSESSSVERSVPGQTELVQVATVNSNGIPSVDSAPAFPNLFISTPANYVGKTFLKDGRRQKYPKPLLKLKSHAASRLPSNPHGGHQNQVLLGEKSASHDRNDDGTEEVRIYESCSCY